MAEKSQRIGKHIFAHMLSARQEISFIIQKSAYSPGCRFKEISPRHIVHMGPQALYRILAKRFIIKENIRSMQAYEE